MTTSVEEHGSPVAGARSGETAPGEPLTPPAPLLAGEDEDGFEPNILRGID